VMLSNLEQIADGTPKIPTATTDPAGLEVVFLFSGAVLPIEPGTYQVTATINDANYQGSAEATFVLAEEGIETGVAGDAIPAKVYPNPVSGILYIEISDKEIEGVEKSLHLFDLTGKRIYAETFMKNKKELNLQQQPAGIYLLIITHKNGSMLLNRKVKRE
jgi:hypothetical protein